MAVVTAKINWVLLNKKADMFFIGENVMVPFGSTAAKDLPAALESAGAESVVIEFRTISDRKARESDQKKFTKRVEALGPLWTRTPWTAKTVDGFVFEDVMTCTISRAG